MNYKPMKARMRATFSAGEAADMPRFERIDKESETLFGVQITLEGEARGHGVWLDRAFCEDVASAGNAMGEAGVKVRFGHPAICSDALGTFLGRAVNFRCVDTKRKDGTQCAGVLADIKIAPESHSAPSGDLGKWVMEAAENNPDTFGQSIVFTYADMKSTNKEGNPILASEFEDFSDFIEAAGENKIFAVLGKLHGTDFTDTPAATDGVFSANDLASEAEAMLDEHPEISEAILGKPDKILEFLDRKGFLAHIRNAQIAALEERLRGMQSLKDREIARLEAAHQEARKEFDGKITELTAALDQAKAETVATQGEVDRLTAELAASADHCRGLEDAHRRLTGGVLTIADETKPKFTTFADFYKEHGGVAAAVRADPETYRRLCEAAGVAAVALRG